MKLHQLRGTNWGITLQVTLKLPGGGVPKDCHDRSPRRAAPLLGGQRRRWKQTTPGTKCWGNLGEYGGFDREIPEKNMEQHWNTEEMEPKRKIYSGMHEM